VRKIFVAKVLTNCCVPDILMSLRTKATGLLKPTKELAKMTRKTKTITSKKSATFDKAAIFAALFAKYDYRANGTLVAHRIYWELGMGL